MPKPSQLAVMILMILFADFSCMNEQLIQLVPYTNASVYPYLGKIVSTAISATDMIAQCDETIYLRHNRAQNLQHRFPKRNGFRILNNKLSVRVVFQVGSSRYKHDCDEPSIRCSAVKFGTTKSLKVTCHATYREKTESLRLHYRCFHTPSVQPS